MKSDGTVVAWGANDLGQTTVPTGLSGVTAIAAGLYFTMAVRDNDTVVAWGNNSRGQSNVPAGLHHVTAIAAGFRHAVALIDPLRSPTPSESWQANHFGSAGNPNASAHADPDGDGLANLLEYALGMPPLSPGGLTIDAGIADGEFSIDYTRAAAATDVSLHAFWAANLDSWSRDGVTETMLSTDGTIENWRASVPTAGRKSLFFRLQALMP